MRRAEGFRRVDSPRAATAPDCARCSLRLPERSELLQRCQYRALPWRESWRTATASRLFPVQSDRADPRNHNALIDHHKLPLTGSTRRTVRHRTSESVGLEEHHHKSAIADTSLGAEYFWKWKVN